MDGDAVSLSRIPSFHLSTFPSFHLSSFPSLHGSMGPWHRNGLLPVGRRTPPPTRLSFSVATFTASASCTQFSTVSGSSLPLQPSPAPAIPVWGWEGRFATRCEGIIHEKNKNHVRLTTHTCITRDLLGHGKFVNFWSRKNGSARQQLACARLRVRICNAAYLVVKAQPPSLHGDEDVVGLAGNLYSFLGLVAEDANSNARTGEGMAIY